MKAIKYLLMGVLLAGFSATANAQEEELNAALSAIKSKAGNAADAAKTAYKKNKKNPEALMKIARAFYEQKDTAGAIQFANYANEAISMPPHICCLATSSQHTVPMVVRLPATTTRLSTSIPRTPRDTRNGLWYIVRSVRSRLLRSCRT